MGLMVECSFTLFPSQVRRTRLYISLQADPLPLQRQLIPPLEKERLQRPPKVPERGATTHLAESLPLKDLDFSPLPHPRSMVLESLTSLSIIVQATDSSTSGVGKSVTLKYGYEQASVLSGYVRLSFLRSSY